MRMETEKSTVQNRNLGGKKIFATAGVIFHVDLQF